MIKTQTLHQKDADLPIESIIVDEEGSRIILSLIEGKENPRSVL